MVLQRPIRRAEFSNTQLKLIRRSVARQCTPAEFDEFMAVAALCGLDPLRRQIAPLIVAADDSKRRRLIPWTTIDGLRVIAARNGDYRPMEGAPLIEYDRARVDEAVNPLGIVRAEVRAWKAHDGAWHAVVGEAWWDEFAPVRCSRAAPSLNVEIASSTETHLDSAWRKMGRVMISKCAEAQALRRGWPDLLSGLYGEEELSATRLAEHTASELLLTARDEQHRKRMAMRTLWFTAEPGAPFEPVRACDVEAFVTAIYLRSERGASIRQFDADNRSSLATYWEWMPQEAFRLKMLSEALQGALNGEHGAGSDARRAPVVNNCAQDSGHDAQELGGGGDYE
ncbi:MAG: phage recombination protein Bet [Hyphomonadaceae bacterium]|nr:phage recombination protein Bet [Hyphomonadaceae bacterium]